MARREAVPLKSKKAKKRNAAFLPWVTLLLLPAAVIPFLFLRAAEARTEPQACEGLSVVERLAERDPAEVERVVRRQEEEQRKKQAAADREADRRKRLAALEEGSVWEYFSDYLILGDSRAVGFTVYHLLDPARVLAEGGLTIRNIPDYLDEVRVWNPAYIYLCFGLNDTGVGYWDTPEEYAAEMRQRIDELRQAAPDARIIISSILPATEAALKRSPVWRKIPAFSKAVSGLCGSNGVAFADNSGIAKEYMDTLWDEDGVHLQEGFYQYWAKNLLAAAVEADFSYDTDTRTFG